MVFEEILEAIWSNQGVEGVVFLDSEGEAISSFGFQDQETLRLLGAYQGIVLAAAGRLGLSADRTVITLGGQRSILTQHLKDGYFISVIFSSDVNFAYARFRFQDAYALLKQEL